MTDRPDDDEAENYFGDDGEPLETQGSFLAVIDGGMTPTALDVDLCALPEHDVANARRLMARNSGRVLVTKERGPGVFDGRRFDFEHGEAAFGRLAQETAARMLSHEAPAFFATQRRRKAESVPDFEKRARRFYGFCLGASNNARIRAMCEQAEHLLMTPMAAFDADPDRLALANGTLELPRDGRLPQFTPAHDPAHRITKLATAAYDPAAKCPQFLAFLERTQPDPEMRAFLARVAGYCLTGHIFEQAFFIFQGKGGDGKSTYLIALGHVLGELVANANIETFLHRERKGDAPSSDIARLSGGVRLVNAPEPEQGARFAEAMLKKVTGGDRITARFMFREDFEFDVQWKLIISCNRKPQIRGDDRGIWRRTLVVPWPVSIPEAEFDRALPEKLKGEASGILNWMLAGWADWLEQGLAPPQAVKDAVADYRLNSNPFGAWFDECCVAEKGGRVAAARLLKSYRGWVNGQGFEPMSETAFGRAMSDRNLGRQKSVGVIYRTGVALNAAGEEAVEAFDRANEAAMYGDVR